MGREIRLGKNISNYGVFKDRPFYIEIDGKLKKTFKSEKMLKSYYNRFLRPKGKHNLK